jgi:fucose permease
LLIFFLNEKKEGRKKRKKEKTTFSKSNYNNVLFPYLQVRVGSLLLALMRKIFKFPAVDNPPGSTTLITSEKLKAQPQEK